MKIRKTEGELGVDMNAKEAIAYVESLQALGSRPGLDSIRNLCSLLGNPQDNLSFIHIAGTNGKGSVSAFTAAILQEAGYKVGRYNSPTIRDYRERILTGNQKITKEALGRLMAKVKEACDTLVSQGKPHPTAFEIETALAFLYFCEKKCDFVVLEAGMGGLLDATNLITTTQVAVLTAISMDHMGFLGSSLSQIAQQKAGIIKPGCMVASAQQHEEVSAVISARCRELSVPLLTVQTEDASCRRCGISQQTFMYQDKLPVEIHLAGTYQIENALLALKVIEALRQRGTVVPGSALIRGMKKAKWQGRFQVLARNPYFIVDGAHNEEAARKLVQSLQFYFTNKKIIYIMGILKDKEYEKIIQITAPFAESIITIRTPDNPRAMDAYELASVAMRYHPKVTAAGSVEEAVEMSYLLADKDSVILAFGSLSYLGIVMDILEKQNR